MVTQIDTTSDDGLITLSEVAARWVDDTYALRPDSYPQSAVQFAKLRLISTIVFPIFAAVDMIQYTLHAVYYLNISHLASDQKTSTTYHALAEKSAYIALGSFFGVLTSPIGLLYSDGVTHHFLSDPFPNQPNRIAPYGQHDAVTAGKREVPKDVEEVVEIVQRARENKKKISISGAGLSQGGQTLPVEEENSISIDMRRINSVTIDPATRTATVGAGATWQDLQREANPYGLAVQVMQASNVFTIGGSLSTNIHGWAHHAGTLINTIESLTIVNPQGKLITVGKDDDLFSHIIAGFGLFGVIVEVKIALTKNELLVEHSEAILPKDYPTYFDKEVLEDPTVDMHLYRLSLNPLKLLKDGVAVSYKKTPSPIPEIKPLYDEPPRGTIIDRIKLHIARRSIGTIPAAHWLLTSRSLLANNGSAQTRNEIMRPPIGGVFNHSKADTEWLQEYFVRKEDLPDFLEYLGDTLMDNQVKLFNATVRYVKRDDKAKLSYSPGEDRFAIVLFFNQSLASKEIKKTTTWTGKIMDWLGEHKGAYYLPYQPMATRKQFEACYKNAKEFAEKKKKIDPDNMFTSRFFKKYIKQPQEAS